MIYMCMQTGYDRRARLCGRCHSWFLTEGARRRFCESCRIESEGALALPGLGRQEDERELYAEAMTAGNAATHERCEDEVIPAVSGCQLTRKRRTCELNRGKR